MTRFPIRRPKPVAELPAGGTPVRVEASEEELAALADVFGVPAVKRLVADLLVRPFRGVGAAVEGTVEGVVVQDCVVTLEPVEQAVSEAISVRLMPAGEGGLAAWAAAGGEVEVDPLGEDPPEPFEGGRIDLGAIAAEHFALGIDPYPRRPGVAFDPEAAGVGPDTDEDGNGAPGSPFAALSALAGRPGGGTGA